MLGLLGKLLPVVKVQVGPLLPLLRSAVVSLTLEGLTLLQAKAVGAPRCGRMGSDFRGLGSILRYAVLTAPPGPPRMHPLRADLLAAASAALPDLRRTLLDELFAHAVPFLASNPRRLPREFVASECGGTRIQMLTAAVLHMVQVRACVRACLRACVQPCGEGRRGGAAAHMLLLPAAAGLGILRVSHAELSRCCCRSAGVCGPALHGLRALQPRAVLRPRRLLCRLLLGPLPRPVSSSGSPWEPCGAGPSAFQRISCRLHDTQALPDT